MKAQGKLSCLIPLLKVNKYRVSLSYKVHSEQPPILAPTVVPITSYLFEEFRLIIIVVFRKRSVIHANQDGLNSGTYQNKDRLSIRNRLYHQGRTSIRKRKRKKKSRRNVLLVNLLRESKDKSKIKQVHNSQLYYSLFI